MSTGWKTRATCCRCRRRGVSTPNPARPCVPHVHGLEGRATKIPEFGSLESIHTSRSTAKAMRLMADIMSLNCWGVMD